MTADDADWDDVDDAEWVDDEAPPRRPTTDRKARRNALRAELADVTDQEGDFHTTYQPGRFETGWLLSSLTSFYQQNLISDVLAYVKGGKEANVYCCQAHPATGMSLLAAKVYRPRQFRNLRNDIMYREGRSVLTAEGRPVKNSDHRLMRALGKKTEFGLQVQHTSWLMYEYTTIERLYQAGAAVPQPVAASDNAILMSYQGAIQRPAPTLSELQLEAEEAAPLFEEVLRNITLMLQQALVHGDLSAYNILYWAGDIVLIDFPQVIDIHTNRNAAFLLRRDIDRVCDYFARQGVSCDPAAIMERLWSRYGETEAGERLSAP